MSGRLIVLDKHPGVRPLGVGETWRRLCANILLKVAGTESNMVCQDDQLCSGIKAVIDGAIHWVQYIWDKNSYTQEWGVLLVDAKKALNEINQVEILWKVQRVWPSGAHFVFNWYCHWSLLVLQNGDGTVGPSPGYLVLYQIPEGDTSKNTIYEQEMSYGKTVTLSQTTHNVSH